MALAFASDKTEVARKHRPIGGKILIEIHRHEKSSGGVLLPPNEWSTPYLEAEVLAVGPGRRVENALIDLSTIDLSPLLPNTVIVADIRHKPEVEVGDRVWIDRSRLNNPAYCTPVEKREDNTLFFVTEADILSIIEV